MLLSLLIAWIGSRRLLVHPSLRALTHDNVTGLANRATFLERLSAMIEQSAGNREPLAVFVLRLSRLQEIYDGLGYDAGVMVLREIRRRLEGATPQEPQLARLQSE